MGNKKTLVTVAMILALALVAGGWFLSRNKKTVVTPDGTGTLQVQTEETKFSIADLLARGTDLKCTYKAESAESGTAETTLYISGKKMRADSSGANAEGEKFASAMINDGEFTYVWTPGEKEGVKMPIDQSIDTKDAWKGQATYVDPNQKADYKCESWGVDATMFALPSGVEFTDLSQMMKTQCAMCDSLTGEQKDTCRKSLGCL